MKHPQISFIMVFKQGYLDILKNVKLYLCLTEYHVMKTNTVLN